MSDDEFELEMSPLCQTLSSECEELQIEIYGDGSGKWILEIVDAHGNSTVWDEVFDTDSAALSEARKTILKERSSSFVGPSDGKSDGEWR